MLVTFAQDQDRQLGNRAEGVVLYKNVLYKNVFYVKQNVLYYYFSILD